MTLLDGKALSQKIEINVQAGVKELKNKSGSVPGLAVILVGQDPASAAYVNMKKKACDRVGFYSVTHEMPEDISQEAIENTIIMMNKNPNIDGILIQLPLPKQIDTTKILLFKKSAVMNSRVFQIKNHLNQTLNICLSPIRTVMSLSCVLIKLVYLQKIMVLK